MGIDEKIWIDIHGPKDEIDVIQSRFSSIDYETYESIRRSCGEAKANTIIEMLGLNTVVPCCPELKQLDFGPLCGGNFTRKNERYLYGYCSYTIRSSDLNTAESIKKLSKHFPNTLIRYTIEYDEEGRFDVLICRHVNGKHVVFSTGWNTWERWHSWSADNIRKLNEECNQTTTTVECGCEALSMPCEYASPIYDCGLEVLGTDKKVVEMFEKRGVKVNKNRYSLFIRFQYTKNPIKLMEWLSKKYKECIFVCEYSNEKGIQCVWSNYRAFHYPYIKSL